jgi:hypothetical protein
MRPGDSAKQFMIGQIVARRILIGQIAQILIVYKLYYINYLAWCIGQKKGKVNYGSKKINRKRKDVK